jgi:hypothetical protein
MSGSWHEFCIEYANLIHCFVSREWKCNSVVECVLSMCNTLGSITRKNEEEKENQRKKSLARLNCRT